MSNEKKQVNAKAGEQLFGKFVNELSETYKTKKIIMFGVVEPEELKGSASPQLVFGAHGDQTIDFKEFSFQLFKMIGKISNLHGLDMLKQATLNVKKNKSDIANQ